MGSLGQHPLRMGNRWPVVLASVRVAVVGMDSWDSWEVCGKYARKAPAYGIAGGLESEERDELLQEDPRRFQSQAQA